MLVAVTCLCASSAAAGGWEVGAQAGYFEPQDEEFRSFYDAGPIYGLHAGWISSIGVGAWALGEVYPTQAQYNGKSHQAYLTTAAGLAIYQPLPAAAVSPVFGFGWSWHHLDDESASAGKPELFDALGFHALGDLRFRLYDGLAADLMLHFSSAHASKLTYVDIGGWTSTAGLTYVF